MTYETLDWEAEAKRVARAFGIERECRFVPHYAAFEGEEDKMMFNPRFVNQISSIKGACFIVHYHESFRQFALFSEWDGTLRVHISYEGEVLEVQNNKGFKLQSPLARALFHLDLLTPEVEAALNVSISHHEKLEWLREFEGVGGVNELPREVAEISIAFGAFQVYEGEYIWNFLFHNPIPDDDIWAQEHEPKVFNVVVGKSQLSEWDFLNLWCIFTYEFCSDQWYGEQARKAEATKGIAVLGGLEWLANGGIETTAHERLEWTLEYEERLKALSS